MSSAVSLARSIVLQWIACRKRSEVSAERSEVLIEHTHWRCMHETAHARFSAAFVKQYYNTFLLVRLCVTLLSAP